ncbi:peptidase T [Vibrio sp. HA2012]|uniref:peptidase T n=1 Tax=Vibrio sp. HA2012 TaxID=1971595 RepID=UPI000C2C9117|nr:peptidase T [Vibrio sp. HA2012]PJC87872.1 peptidase T [Vibrio sp. HA2012]
MNNLVNRFMHYVTFDTQSDADSLSCPSTPGQLVLAQELKNELISIGLSEVTLDENGYLMATLPSNVDYDVPVIGFIAHMDTAPDETGKNVSPQVVKNYQGGAILLGNSGEMLLPEQYPDLDNLLGHDLITTDGTTLLGADNKAGIAEIITAMEHLLTNTDIPHGDIRICFTPDEEIGRGADHFDVDGFGAEWAYTIDGGLVGELEYENFNASSAKVVCHGVSVHPGTAKGKLVNSMLIAAQFQLMMPKDETPECTDGYEGFYHLTSIKSGIATTELHYIIRDFERSGLERRKVFMQGKVDELNTILSKGSVSLEISDSYFNMKEMVEPHKHIIELAHQAMQACGVEPMVKPIRGGTDGARLSFMGLPCPNIFTGGYNFHGIHEFISINGMQKTVEVIMNIAEKTAIRQQ